QRDDDAEHEAESRFEKHVALNAVGEGGEKTEGTALVSSARHLLHFAWQHAGLEKQKSDGENDQEAVAEHGAKTLEEVGDEVDGAVGIDLCLDARERYVPAHAVRQGEHL